MFDKLFRNKKKDQKYFALVLSDRPTDGFKFESNRDCSMFVVTGETIPRDVIPRTVLKEAMERLEKIKEGNEQNKEVDQEDEITIKDKQV